MKKIICIIVLLAAMCVCFVGCEPPSTCGTDLDLDEAMPHYNSK